MADLTVSQAIDDLMSLSTGGDYVMKLGDNAGTNKLSILDSDSAEVASLDSNGRFRSGPGGSGDAAYGDPSGNAGLYFNGSTGSSMWFTVNSSYVAGFNANIFSLVNAGTLGWESAGPASATDLRLVRDAAGILAQRNGTNAQAYRVYNTDNGADDEYGYLSWQESANVFEIGTAKTGSATQRNLIFNSANRQSHITDVSSGTDTAYETAINAIIATLESFGLTATS